jgi:hypothetical protein
LFVRATRGAADLAVVDVFLAVIPAKAGIHVAPMQKRRWIPAFAGMTAGKFKTLRERVAACG